MLWVRKFCVWGFFCFLFVGICGCVDAYSDEEAWIEREYEIVEELDIPKELEDQINLKKEEPFYITYGEGKWLYICRGYGKKDSEGYMVNVEEFSETEKFLYLRTSLTGPTKEEAKGEETFPYLVIRTARCEKQVAFT